MKLIDEQIWRDFFRFEISGKAFNRLSDAEKNRYANTLRFSAKEALTDTFSPDPVKLKKVFKMIDRKTEEILFG